MPTSDPPRECDVLVVGGGIVGLATAYQVTRLLPGRRVVVLEKEPEVAAHQTGHNSGVLHTGIYYKPGSLKAINCRAGKQAMEAFCRDEGIDQCLGRTAREESGHQDGHTIVDPSDRLGGAENGLADHESVFTSRQVARHVKPA